MPPVVVLDPEHTVILSDPNNPLEQWTYIPGAKEVIPFLFLLVVFVDFDFDFLFKLTGIA